MSIEFEAISDTGRKRKINQDNYLADPVTGIFAVADGMGGQAGGEFASEIAISRIKEFINRSLGADDTWPTHFDPALSRNHNRLRSALLLANKQIKLEADRDSKLQGMGTTAVCVLIEKDIASLAHVGDSRAYLFRRGELERLTTDHSWVGEQINQGVISEDQARDHPFRNVVTRALGAMDELETDLSDLKLEHRDVLLLCSDGLNSMVPDEEIKSILASNDNLQRCAQSLVNEANNKGGHDNITVILIRYP